MNFLESLLESLLFSLFSIMMLIGAFVIADNLLKFVMWIVGAWSQMPNLF